jgi:alcohol dehydrogenase class IV
MAYRFKMPAATYMGTDALYASEAALRRLGKKALVVSGKHVTKTGAVRRLGDFLGTLGIDWELFNDIPGEPTDEMVRAGVLKYREAGCDFLIGIGGGSPIDTAKAIAAMSVLEGEISGYMGAELTGDFPPVVALPTTAGTGSEATVFTVITDSKRDVKMLLKGDALLPALAVVDPALTLSAPAGITAATGMDALTHAVESFVSKKANDLTDMYALDAVRRIFAFLPAAYKNGRDAKAREEMAVAAFEAGVCINNASVTLVHGMSRPIGALFHVPHGISNAMLLAACMEYSLPGCPERFAKMARAIGAADAKAGDIEAGGAFIEALGWLCAKLEIPTLRGYGIEKDTFLGAIDKMADDAIGSGSPGNTRREVGAEDARAIYRKLIEK